MWNMALPLHWHELGIFPERRRSPAISKNASRKILQFSSVICLRCAAFSL